MSTVREPLLKTVAILDLCPTQMTVGMREVKAKRKRWRDESKKKGEEFLGKHMIPVILGPKHRHYIIDHHHLARALHDEGVKEVAVTDVANLSKLDQDSFWYVMENRDWTHPFVDGRRRPYSDLPKSVDKLVDDPFRSLAGELRRAGGFANSANSCGRIFCVGGSSGRPLTPTSSTPSRKPWNWPKRNRRATYPAGVVPFSTIEGTPILREKSARASPRSAFQRGPTWDGHT
jgi:hypothetical protein